VLDSPGNTPTVVRLGLIFLGANRKTELASYQISSLLLRRRRCRWKWIWRRICAGPDTRSRVDINSLQTSPSIEHGGIITCAPASKCCFDLIEYFT
jgi:hypothetical protein